MQNSIGVLLLAWIYHKDDCYNVAANKDDWLCFIGFFSLDGYVLEGFSLLYGYVLEKYRILCKILPKKPSVNSSTPTALPANKLRRMPRKKECSAGGCPARIFSNQKIHCLHPKLPFSQSNTGLSVNTWSYRSIIHVFFISLHINGAAVLQLTTR